MKNTKSVTYECPGCGKEATAFSSRLARVLLEPIPLLVNLILALSLTAVFHWFTTEMLIRADLNHVVGWLSDGFISYIYFFVLFLIASYVVIATAMEMKCADDIRNGVVVFYGDCEACRHKVRFAKHIATKTTPWFVSDLKVIDDYEENTRKEE